MYKNDCGCVAVVELLAGMLLLMTAVVYIYIYMYIDLIFRFSD